MGDVLEIETSVMTEATKFYRVSSSALSFEIKGQSVPKLGLTNKPGSMISYWIKFYGDGYCCIEKVKDNGRNEQCVSANSTYTLSQEVYRKFWVMWDTQTLRLGEGDDISKPIAECPNKLDLKHVIFTSNYDCKWRVKMPPQAVAKMNLPKPLKAIRGGDLEWKTPNDQLPDNALIGGYENGEAMYIIRAKFRQSLTPGKFLPSEGLASIPWGSRANQLDVFEVLCGCNCKWVPVRDNLIPVDAVVGGYSENAARENLYIGRGYHEGNLIVGKIQLTHRVCYVPYDDKEVALKDYQVMIAPEQNANISNEYYISALNSSSDTDD